MNDGRWTSRLKTIIAPALLVVLPLCLFGPHTIFSGNEAEFSAYVALLFGLGFIIWIQGNLLVADDWEDDGWKQPYFDALDVLELHGPATNWLARHVDLPWRPRGETRLRGVQTRDLKFGP